MHSLSDHSVYSNYLSKLILSIIKFKLVNISNTTSIVLKYDSNIKIDIMMEDRCFYTVIS